MAFPTIPTAAASRVLVNTQANTTATRTFPSLTGLTKNAGDLLIAICVVYQSSAAAGAVFSGWTGGFTEFLDVGGSTSNMSIGAAYKWSDGTESGTIAVTQAATVVGHAAMILLSIPEAHLSTPPEGGTIVNGTAAAANIAALNPSGWDSEDTLWIAVAGVGETGTGGAFDGLSAAPANYNNYAETGISADAVGGVEAAVAFRQLAAASDDPGTFTVDVSNARNSAVLLAVRPKVVQQVTINPASESDSPQAVSFVQGTVSVAVVSETDLANTIVPLQPLPAAETSTALVLDFEIVAAHELVPVAETDSAGTLRVPRLVAAAVTETAVALTVTKPIVKTVAHAAETDSVQAVTFSQVSDFDIAAVLETDSAQTLTYSQAGAYTLSPAAETDTVQAVTAAKRASVAAAAETDLAVGFTAGVSITAAAETDTGVALTKSKRATAVAVAETDAAQAVAYSQAGAFNIAPASETDTAQPLAVPQTVSITFAGTLEAAVAVTHSRSLTVAAATETSTALTLTHVKTVSFVHAAETDEARPLPFGGVYAISTVSETNTAVALRYAAMPRSGTLQSVLTGRIVRAHAGRVTRPKQGVLS